MNDVFPGTSLPNYSAGHVRGYFPSEHIYFSLTQPTVYLAFTLARGDYGRDGWNALWVARDVLKNNYRNTTMAFGIVYKANQYVGENFVTNGVKWHSDIGRNAACYQCPAGQAPPAIFDETWQDGLREYVWCKKRGKNVTYKADDTEESVDLTDSYDATLIDTLYIGPHIGYQKSEKFCVGYVSGYGYGFYVMPMARDDGSTKYGALLDIRKGKQQTVDVKEYALS